MFDQPVLEGLLRSNITRYPEITLRCSVEVTDIAALEGGRTRVTFTDRDDGTEHRIEADYLLGYGIGANSLVRNRIGAAMEDLRFEQRWLVIDVASDEELQQWTACTSCATHAGPATFMRIGPNRYRWEFRLLDGEKAEDFRAMGTLGPLIAPWTERVDAGRLEIIRVAEYTFRAKIADHWRRGNTFLLGDAAHLDSAVRRPGSFARDCGTR